LAVGEGGIRGKENRRRRIEFFDNKETVKKEKKSTTKL
jgi:hypothetical protein